jgi:hypothetical protein
MVDAATAYEAGKRGYNSIIHYLEDCSKFAEGVDKMDYDLKQKVLQGKSNLKHEDIREIAKAEPEFVAKSEEDIMRKAKEIRGMAASCN